MPEIIIADTSCLVVLSRTGQLELLHRLYGQVTVTPEVVAEFGEAMPPWIRVRAAADAAMKRVLSELVDAGEASALALALEVANSTLIVDDLKARKLAVRLNLRFTGTLGVMLKAHERGLVPSMREQIARLRSAGFRVSEEIAVDLLRRAGEE